MRDIYYGRYASHHEYIAHHFAMANTHRQLAENQRAAGNDKGVEHHMDIARMHEGRGREGRFRLEQDMMANDDDAY